MKKYLIILALLATAVFATGSSYEKIITVAPEIEEDISISDELSENIWNSGKIIDSVLVNGIVKEVKDNQIIIVTDISAPDAITILNVGDAKFIDMLKGNYTDITSVKVDESISVYCSPIAPMIYPPQLHALTVLVNNGTEGAAALRIVTGKEIVNGNPDTPFTGIAYNSADGEYVVWFYENSDITDATGNKINASEIKEDMEILVWCDMIAPSYPAQANAKKAVVLNYSDNTLLSDTAGFVNPIVISGESLLLDGDMIIHAMEKNKPVTTAQNITMYPVRAIAEALGLDVEWDNGTVSILEGNMTRAVFKINENSYSFSSALGLLNDGNTFHLINDSTYAPQEFFESVLDCYFE